MGEGLGLSVERTACDDPAHVRPPGTFLWSVRIAEVVAVLMMDPMRRHPGDRTSFQGQSAAPVAKTMLSAWNGFCFVVCLASPITSSATWRPCSIVLSAVRTRSSIASVTST
jgi:hypothetical protein